MATNVFIQPTTGHSRMSNKGVEDEVITLLKLLERLYLLTDFDADNYNSKFILNRLKSCQQQHHELGERAARLLQDSLIDEVLTGGLLSEEQPCSDLRKPRSN